MGSGSGGGKVHNRMMRGMRAAPIALVVCVLAHGQSLVNPARLNPSTANFDPVPNEQRIKCDVTPLRPLLNFSFRFQSGYRVQIPLSPYAGGTHNFSQLLRVT